ncbi:LysR family transcriptional regulator [Fictibacillus enclensis]|uniref:LysR family transcriptional regulator n=1 Tax=Fictibacillus enclensis TaxID=1017270 RepID=UPI0024C0A836|nr:LysR family transcriptional regulator [Fictibacillus enclensis]WHY72946.1 LysR family transcriptional regulator [Fictibacillus enclensis]
MELRQLEYFMVICEELHFSRAAEKILVSQPNLSQQIKLLENELGMPLFHRTGKKISLTEAGGILQEQCRHIFSHIKQAQDSIAELKMGKGGSLTIGVLPGDADLVFDALLLDFHRTHPDTSVSLIETMDVTGQVLSGGIDIGITIRPDPDQRLVEIPLFEETFSLAVHADSLYAHKKSLYFKDVQKMKMVMFPSYHQCRKLIDRYCLEAGFKIKPSMETTTLSSLIAMVEKDIGAAILPTLLLGNLKHPKIKTVALIGPVPSQKICLIYRKDKFLGFTAKAFIEKVQTYINAAKETLETKNS